MQVRESAFSRKLRWLWPAVLALVVALFTACGNSASTPAADNGSDGQGGADTDRPVDEIEITVTLYPTGLDAVPYNVGIE